MKTVGLRQLKARLSEYVSRSRDGEHIVITDRGREVAELVPLSDARQAMNALREAGRVKWNGGKPKGLRGHSARGEPISETVIEARRRTRSEP